MSRSTELPGIRYLFDTASRRLSENRDDCHALILIDIDNFAEDNAIMRKIGELLSEAISRTDLLTRYGDDRFAVFTSGFSNRVELEKFISKLLYRISVAQLGDIASPTAVAGAAMDEQRSSAAEMFMCAEIAISRAKAEAPSGGYVIFSKEDELSQETEAAEADRPRRKIQRVLNYAFDAFVKPDDSRIVIKDVLAYIGEEYGFRRIFLATGDSISGSIISWNGNSVSDISDAECLKVLENVRKSEHIKGKAHIDGNRYSFGMMEGYTLTSVICYEDAPDASERSEAEQSEMRTLAKMFSVYKATVLSSMSAEDELIYYRTALEENSTACLIIDAESYRVVFMNRYAEEIFGNVTVGTPCPKNIMETLERIKNGEEEGADDRGAYKYDTFEKNVQKWLSSSILCIRRSGGEYAFLITVTDISAHMDNAKTMDKLTGLLTHEGFEIEAQKVVYGTDDEYDLAVFKVFNFRKINDEYGYETGDRVLTLIAEKLGMILAQNERASRASGSRFYALFRRGNFAILRSKLDYLFKVVEDDMSKRHSDLSVSFMCGVYPIDKKTFRLSGAIDGANLVIKSATAGKYLTSNVIEYYDEEISRSLEERKKIENEMVNALRQNEFEVVYQPKVSLRTGKVYGAEALIRWHRPDGTVVQPGFFVPIFEDNEFVLEMDNWVYRRVLSRMKQWAEQGMQLPVVSVNVSRLHLRDTKFPEKFEKLVDNYGIPHSAVELELTESTFVKNYDRLITIMEDIRSRGFKISIDDFGTGYSTLNLISVLPVDVLKLDGNFFMKNQLTEKNKKVIESIIMLAKNLGLMVISEGVETDEQVAFLKENYCDAVQGYYYYKPMSEEQFYKILSEQ